MKKRWLVTCAFLVCCGSSDKWDKPVKDLEGFKDKTCACKDKACTDAVRREEADWQVKMMDTFKSEKKPPKEIMEKVDGIEREMRECRHHIADKAGDPAVVEKASDKPAVDAVAKMTELKDAMCACKDKACAKQVDDDMKKWGAEQSAAASTVGVPKLSDEATKKLTELDTQIDDCMRKASAGN